MVATLGTDIADPARSASKRCAQSHAPVEGVQPRRSAPARMAELAEFMPGGLAGLGARAASRFEMATRGEPAVNCVVSNVPGPQVPLYFAGARLVRSSAAPPSSTAWALLHGVTSYCGEVVAVRRRPTAR